MLVTSDSLQDLLLAAITGKTGAGTDVFSPRTWPLRPPLTPVILVQSPTEHKQSLGRSGAPQFTCVTTIRLIGRIGARPAPGDAADAVSVRLLAALAVLQRQIEVAVINEYALWASAQQLLSVEVTNDVKSDGDTPIGELVMDFAFEFYQGPEAFAPNPATPIEEMAIFADLLNVFSPSGVFDETPFADQAVPPIRDHGPDGRAEGALVIFLEAQDLDFTDPANSGLLPGL